VAVQEDEFELFGQPILSPLYQIPSEEFFSQPLDTERMFSYYIPRTNIQVI
jgi:hypothetical protein